jgi:hypothetical protein
MIGRQRRAGLLVALLGCAGCGATHRGEAIGLLAVAPESQSCACAYADQLAVVNGCSTQLTARVIDVFGGAPRDLSHARVRLAIEYEPQVGVIDTVFATEVEIVDNSISFAWTPAFEMAELRRQLTLQLVLETSNNASTIGVTVLAPKEPQPYLLCAYWSDDSDAAPLRQATIGSPVDMVARLVGPVDQSFSVGFEVSEDQNDAPVLLVPLRHADIAEGGRTATLRSVALGGQSTSSPGEIYFAAYLELNGSEQAADSVTSNLLRTVGK